MASSIYDDLILYLYILDALLVVLPFSRDRTLRRIKLQIIPVDQTIEAPEDLSTPSY